MSDVGGKGRTEPFDFPVQSPPRSDSEDQGDDREYERQHEQRQTMRKKISSNGSIARAAYNPKTERLKE